MTDPSGDYTSPPQKNKTAMTVAVTLGSVAVVIALVAAVMAMMKAGDKDDVEAKQAAETSTGQVQQPATPAPGTVTQTETHTETASAPAPAPRTPTRSPQSEGYSYSCPNSYVVRKSSATTCQWADKVAARVRSEGPFSGVEIYSDGTNRWVRTTCRDDGEFYVCQGQNYPFAVTK